MWCWLRKRNTFTIQKHRELPPGSAGSGASDHLVAGDLRRRLQMSHAERLMIRMV